MPAIDWSQLSAVLVGASLGSYLGYRLNARRAVTRAETAWSPKRASALLALSAFLGVALAEDLARLLGREQPGGFFLTKYVFAAAIGLGNLAHLRRRAVARKPRTSDA
jgi:hypothetical protein